MCNTVRIFGVTPPQDLRKKRLRVTLDDVAGCVQLAKTLADGAALRLADEEHKQTTSVLHR